MTRYTYRVSATMSQFFQLLVISGLIGCLSLACCVYVPLRTGVTLSIFIGAENEHKKVFDLTLGHTMGLLCVCVV